MLVGVATLNMCVAFISTRGILNLIRFTRHIVQTDIPYPPTQICKKRGPLGACLEQVERTAENDNDKASKYFVDPSADVKAKYDSMTKDVKSEADGNVLIQKLLQQTEQNRERNDRIVKQKTLMNDQGASFGPFSGQVVIMNADGEGFTLLSNPQAMRLKDAGYIKDRKFVKQPTKEVISAALEAPESEGGGFFKGLFGGEE